MSKILLIALLLVGCNDIERNQERNRLIGVAWDKAEVLDVTYYKCKSSDRFLQTFEMDGYKFVIYNNGYGSAMVAVPLNLKETHKLGSTLYPKSLRLEKR